MLTSSTIFSKEIFDSVRKQNHSTEETSVHNQQSAVPCVSHLTAHLYELTPRTGAWQAEQSTMYSSISIAPEVRLMREQNSTTRLIDGTSIAGGYSICRCSLFRSDVPDTYNCMLPRRVLLKCTIYLHFTHEI